MVQLEDRCIGVVGGTGRFGQHIARLFENGNDIVISGSTVEKAERVAGENGWKAATNRVAAESADIVVVSVPIDVAVDVVHEVGPSVREDALLCDVTSVKEGPCRAMKEYSGEAVGMHPMFGPGVDPEGQNVILCPVNGEKWIELHNFWNSMGADVHVTEPERHDRAVSVVQGLTHYMELVFAEAVAGLEVEHLDRYATPHFRLFRDFAGRTLDGDPELYSEIQNSNRWNVESRQAFREAGEIVEEAIENGEMERVFDELGRQYDTGEARRRTDRIIDRLDEL